MSAEMDNLNADIDRLIEEANAEREEREETNDDNNDDSNNDNAGDDDNGDSNTTNNADGENGEEESSKGNADDDANQSEESASTEEKAFDEIKTSVNGQEIVLENKEEVEQFIKTQTQNSKTRPSEIDEIVTQAKLSQDDLALLADIKAGKPGALKKLADSNKIDLADADEFEGDYETEFKPTIKTDVDVVLDNINSNTELATKFNEVVSTLPDDFLNALGGNASDLERFAGHIDSGLAQELLPQAIKMTSLGKGTLLENYIKVGEAKFANKSNDKTETSKQTREVSSKEQKLRERASSDADGNKGGKSSDLSVDDLWAEDDLLAKVSSGEIDLRNLS